MMSGKKYKKAKESIEKGKAYPLKEALSLVLEKAFAGFDESVDASLVLGIDTRKSDQQVRGQALLPHGLGKKVKVAVFAKGEQETAAKKAGADYVGAEDLVEKIKGGWLDFDRVISAPDMMPLVSKIAKILGPKGLMPNPKLGTVAMKTGSAVEQEKKGKAVFRADKNGIIHSAVGKKSQGAEKLMENLKTFLQAVVKAKPSKSKGVFLKKMVLSSTMGPGVLVSQSDKTLLGDF